MAESTIFDMVKHIRESIEVYAVVATASIAVLGFGWRTLVTNRDKARRLGQVNRSFQEITKTLTTGVTDKERLAAAILLRRFFDKGGEYSINIMWRKETPYAKAALELMTALLKIEQEGPVQKALADSLILSDSLRSTDLQGANLANAYLGRRGLSESSSKDLGIVLRGVDLYLANLSGASLRHADCQKATFAYALMERTVFDEADLSGADFRRAKLSGARFKNSLLSKANFSGADLSNVNFSGADLTDANFEEVDLATVKFDGAKNPPKYKKHKIQN